MVVVNAGMPVLMPWVGQVAAVLYAWLPGQAIGDALADVLLGRAEPGGRLPVTMPAREADSPVLHAVPVAGQLSYDEGLLVGYRGFDAAGREPLFPFGHGLGYTSWEYESLSVDRARAAPGTDVSLQVTVRNTGPRPGREVVQVYVAGPATGAGRPVRVLGAFGDSRRRARRTGAADAHRAGPGVRALRRAGGVLDLAARPGHDQRRPVIPGSAAVGHGDRRLTRQLGRFRPGYPSPGLVPGAACRALSATCRALSATSGPWRRGVGATSSTS